MMVMAVDILSVFHNYGSKEKITFQLFKIYVNKIRSFAS